MPVFAQRQRRNQRSYLLSPAKFDWGTSRATRAASPFLAQQQALGNQTMQRLLQAKVVQAKLQVGQPGDKYEQEADWVAEQVMRMPEPGNQQKTTATTQAPNMHVQRLCSECEEELHRQPMEEEEEEEETLQTKPLADQITPLVQRQIEPEEEEEEESVQAKLADGALLQRQEEEPEEEETIQTKRASGQTPRVASRLETEIRSLKGGGQPLSESERNFFEPRFGYDFSGVRIHTGLRAIETARALNAKAFTIGQDIISGQDYRPPVTSKGNKLVAHELVHTIQQQEETHSPRQVHRKPPDVQLNKKKRETRKRPFSAAYGRGALRSEYQQQLAEQSSERLKGNPNVYDPNYIPPVKTRFKEEKYLYDFTISAVNLLPICRRGLSYACTRIEARASEGIWPSRITRKKQFLNNRSFNSVLAIDVTAFPVDIRIYVPSNDLKREHLNHELYHVRDAYRTFQVFKTRLSRNIQARIIKNRREVAKNPSKQTALLSEAAVGRIILQEADPFVRDLKRYIDASEVSVHEALEAEGGYSEKRTPTMWKGFKLPALKPGKGSLT